MTECKVYNPKTSAVGRPLRADVRQVSALLLGTVPSGRGR